MDKILLLEKYIKKSIRLALKEQEEQEKRVEKALYFIHRFPGLKRILEELMSPSFGRYVADVSLVAPKPTTFNVGLINGQAFIIYYVGKGNFIAKIAGKKYNPVNIGESERASQAIADLLELNYAPIEQADKEMTQRSMDIRKDLEMSNSTDMPPSGGQTQSSFSNDLNEPTLNEPSLSNEPTQGNLPPNPNEPEEEFPKNK